MELSGCGLASSTRTDSAPVASIAPSQQAVPPSAEMTAAPTMAHPVTPTEIFFPTASPAAETPALAPTVVPQLISGANAARIIKIGGLETGMGLINAISWSPDGSLLAISRGNEVVLYSMNGTDLLQVAALPHAAFIPALAFSPNGEWLATGSRDGTIRVWPVGSIADGASQAATAPIWQAEAHQKGVNSLVFSPDGQWLASGGNDAVARIWNPSTGEPLGMLIGGTFAVPSIAFSPDSKSLAIANGEYIRLRDPESESITGTLLSETPVYTLAYSPDGRLLAAGDISNGIQVWDPSQAFRTGSETYPTPLKMAGHTARPTSYRALVWDIAFNPDGSVLASAGGDQTVRLWDVSSGNLLASLTGHEDAVTSIAFSPDGTLLASGGLDGRLLLWGVP
jgi:WD40 repeat protein